MAQATPADLEEQLAAIWERLLAVGHVGVLHNFFELGGDALLAAGMICEVEEVTGTRLSLHSFYTAPTIVQLAGTIRSQATHHGCTSRAA